MNSGRTLLAFLFVASAAARAQVVPVATATGPTGLPVSGTLHYDLHYAQTTQFGVGQDGQQWSVTSGDASYASINSRFPFTMQYGGGYEWAWNGAPSAGNIFQHLSLSQGIVWRTWNLTAGEDVSYFFQTPTTGFSGVPGTGEPIAGPGSTNQTILTQNTHVLNNSTTIGISHKLDYATSLNIGGSSEQTMYVDGNGINSDALMANAGVTRRLNAHNSISCVYSFSRFNYGGAISASPANGAQISYTQASSLLLGISRQWNTRVSASASVGPQWISSSNSAIMPSSTGVSAMASASDAFRFGTAAVSYSHGVSVGGGYILGAESDIVNGSFSREFGRRMTVGLTGSYMRTAGLSGSGAIYASFGGAQVTRQMGRYFSLFANYTAVDQSSNLQNSTNVLNSLFQVIGFGIGWTPKEMHLKK